MLLLDEPTNHLDLSACVWLKQYLDTYKKILVYLVLSWRLYLHPYNDKHPQMAYIYAAL